MPAGQLDIMFGKGIHRSGSMLDMGVDMGIIHKAGAYFSFNDIRLGREQKTAYLLGRR